MHINNMADIVIIPSAGTRDQPGRIQLHDITDNTLRIKLTPGLIKYHPENNRRAVIMLKDHLRKFLFKLHTTRQINFTILQIVPHAGHILPDHQSEFVGPVIPACRLNLDMLANHVESKLLHQLNIPL